MNGNSGNDKPCVHEFHEAVDGAFSALPPFDPADYLEDLHELDLTETQKIEFLQTLWHIMAAFVDLGWGVNSLQYVLPGLAELSANCEIQAVDNTSADDAGSADDNHAPTGSNEHEP